MTTRNNGRNKRSRSSCVNTCKNDKVSHVNHNNISIIISVVSLFIAILSWSNARSAKLDVVRTRVISEAKAELSNAQDAFIIMNCYAAINGHSYLSGEDEMRKLLAEKGRAIRNLLPTMADANEESLLNFEKEIIPISGTPMQELNEALLRGRVTWSKEQLDRAAEACRIEQ